MTTRVLRTLRATVIGVLILLAQMQEHPALAQDQDRVLLNRDCGAYCTAVVLGRVLSAQPDVEELRRELKTDDSGETSLLAIRDVLRAHGVRVHAVAWTTAPAELPGAFVIGRLNQSVGGNPMRHFVVLEDREPHPVVFQPPRWCFECRWDDVASRLEPVVLVCDRGADHSTAILAGTLLALSVAACVIVARRRRGRPSGPSLVNVMVLILVAAGTGLTSACGDATSSRGTLRIHAPEGAFLGDVKPGLLTRTFVVTNETEETVQFQKLTSSCGCAGIDFDLAPLPPGESRRGEIRIRAGPNESKSVLVGVFPSSGPPLELVFGFNSGSLAGLVFEPLVDLGAIAPGVAATHDIRLQFGGEAKSWLQFVDGKSTIAWRVVRSSSARIVTSPTPGLLQSDVPGAVVTKIEVIGAALGDDDAVLEADLSGVTLRVGVRWHCVVPGVLAPATVVLREAESGLRGATEFRPTAAAWTQCVVHDGVPCVTCIPERREGGRSWSIVFVATQEFRDKLGAKTFMLQFGTDDGADSIVVPVPVVAGE